MAEKYKNVLITGGAGRLGRRVYYNLCKDYNCTLFDQVAPMDSKREAWEPNWKYATFVKGNLNNYGDCLRAVATAKADVILHIGGLPFPSEVIPGTNYKWARTAHEDDTFQSNIAGTYYLLEAAARLGVKKVILAGSFFATGIGNRISGKPWPIDKLPITEDYDCCPEDSYSLSKLVDEQLLKAYASAYGMKTVSFRLQGISYPTNPHISPIEIPVMEKCKDGFYEGHTWQYVDSRDVANAMRLAIEKDLDSDFEAFNIITDKRYEESTADFAKTHWPTIADMAKDIKGPEDRGLFSDKKLRDLLGYHEQYSWRQSDEYPGEGKNDPNDQ